MMRTLLAGIPRLIILATITMVFAAGTLFATEDLSQWSHSKKWYLNTTDSGANVMTDQVNFSVVIRLDSVNFGTTGFNQCLLTGADIRFADQNNSPLAYDIEMFETGLRQAVIWVKVDTVKGNNGTQYITMYWGKADAVSTSSGPSVFSGYKAVWHLNGDVTSVPLAQFNGVSTATSSNMATFLASGRWFNGTSSNKIELPALWSVPPTLLTFSCWIKPETVDPVQQYIVYAGDNGEVGLNLTKDSLCFQVKTTGGTWQNAFSRTHSIAANRWYYVSGSWAKGGKVKCYLNGNLVSSVQTPNEDLKDPGSTFKHSIGAYNNGAQDWFKGTIDEVEISTSVRSSDWIKLSYQNQRADTQKLVSEIPVMTNTVSYPNATTVGQSMQVDGKLYVGTGFETGTCDDITNLEVTGKIQADGLQIKNWLFKQKAPDFVFKPDYMLRSLDNVESFIQKNGHLPEVPSANEMSEKGLDMTQFNMTLLKKIEELTLYTIQQNKRIEELEKRTRK